MFTSGTYWLALAGSAFVYRVLPDRVRTAFLALVSIAFLWSLDASACLVTAGWLAALYAVFALAARRPALRGRATAVLAVSAAAHLVWWKLALAGGGTPAIPLGLSYFVFKLIDLALTAGRGDVPTAPAWDRLLSYFFFFPAFPAGPMARYPDFAPELERRAGLENAVEGATRIAHGLVKRFFIAETMREWWLSDAAVARWIEHLPAQGMGSAWLMVLRQFFYIYLDFSAYSDLAIGGALLHGIRLPENFDFPFLATNLGEFWQRWHMTLTALCRRYVYHPVLAVTRSVPVGIACTMTVISLWHGITLGRFLWGLYQALGLCIYGLHRMRKPPGAESTWSGNLAGCVLTLAFFASAQAFTLVEGGDWRISLRILAKLVALDALAP